MRSADARDGLVHRLAKPLVARDRPRLRRRIVLVVRHHEHRVGDLADVLEVVRRIVERHVDGQPQALLVQRVLQVDQQLEQRLGVLGAVIV